MLYGNNDALSSSAQVAFSIFRFTQCLSASDLCASTPHINSHIVSDLHANWLALSLYALAWLLPPPVALA